LTLAFGRTEQKAIATALRGGPHRRRDEKPNGEAQGGETNRSHGDTLRSRWRLYFIRKRHLTRHFNLHSSVFDMGRTTATTADRTRLSVLENRVRDLSGGWSR
jgi:hypothetical protein